LTPTRGCRTLKNNVDGRQFTHTLGVDLGGGKGKKTALATLRADADGATVIEIAPRGGAMPLYDTALVDAIRSYGDDTLLCVDAPLTLPPCLRCAVPVCPGQDECVDAAVIQMRAISAAGTAGERFRRGKPSITPYTQRTTEVYLAHRLGIVPREALGQGTGPLAARAAHLTRALADRFHLNRNLVEVYPKGTLAALGFARPYKKHLKERETRAEILEALSGDLRFGPGVWRELCIQSDHLFDAVICAYTGYLWARDGWTLPEAVAGSQDGWIWLPPMPEKSDQEEPKAAEG
jgi:predicted RNase H-like nuclease